MKFSCDRCGKKYATADDPAPGRVYKLKCKSCGHLIVVKAQAAGAPALPHQEAAPSFDPAPPEVPLEIGAPEPMAPPPWPEEKRARSGDATTHVSMPAAEEEPPPPPPASSEAGYVDLFGDTGATPLAGGGEPEDPFFAAARGSLPDTYGGGGRAVPDPFAPLREVTPHETVTPEPPPMPKVPVIPKPAHQKSIVPIALMGGGVALLVGILAVVILTRKDSPERPAPPAKPAVVAKAQPPPPVAEPTPPEPPPAQAEPAPPPPDVQAKQAEEARRAEEERRRREREEAAARAAQEKAERAERDRLARQAKERAAAEAKERARAAADAKARAAADARERAREAAEAKARAAAEAKERARLAREEKARAAAEAKERAREAAEGKARAAAEERARLAREREERAQAIREAAARERERDDRVAAATEADEAQSLTQSQIEGVLRASKPSFDSCMRAASGGEVKLDGRRIMLRLNIQPSGAVTYPTIDDVTVNGAELGSCLKSAARSMLFPKFSGDTMHVEVPLALAGR